MSGLQGLMEIAGHGRKICSIAGRPEISEVLDVQTGTMSCAHWFSKRDRNMRETERDRCMARAMKLLQSLKRRRSQNQSRISGSSAGLRSLQAALATPEALASELLLWQATCIVICVCRVICRRLKHPLAWQHFNQARQSCPGSRCL